MDDRNGVAQQAGYIVRYIWLIYLPSAIICRGHEILNRMQTKHQMFAVTVTGPNGTHTQRIRTDSNEFLNTTSHFTPFYHFFRITNDAREGEMEENMGQVNTMIGNVHVFFFQIVRKKFDTRPTKFINLLLFFLNSHKFFVHKLPTAITFHFHEIL